MKTTKTFENATLRTINNGYIELDYNGKTHCFDNASVVSVNNGSISIEVGWKPEKGELIRAVGCNIDCYVIFNYKSGESVFQLTLGDQILIITRDEWNNLDNLVTDSMDFLDRMFEY